MSPTKWKHLDGMILKRDVVCEWIIMIMYDHYATIMVCGHVQGLGKNLATQIGYSMTKPEYDSRNTVTMSM